MATNIGPKISIDGYSDYKKQIDNIVQQAKTLDSEMKEVTSSFDKETTAEEKNAKTKDVLQKQIKVQEERVKLLSEVVEQCAKQYGETDTKTLKWKEALNNAKASLNKMNSEIESGVEDTKDLGNEIKKTEEKTSTFGSVLKANLSADLIKNAVNGIIDTVQKLGVALVDCSRNAATFADEIITMSSITEIGAEALQEFYYMTDLIDVSVDTLKNGLKKMTPMMKSYAEDVQKAAKAEEEAAKTRNKRKKQQILDSVTYSETTKTLKALGVAVVDSAGKMRSQEDVFWDVVSALQGVDDQTQRNIYAQTIFGNSYAELNPLLDQTADNLTALRQEAHDTGYVMEDSVLGTLGSLDDTFVRFNLLIQTVKNKLGTALAPTIEAVVTKLSEFIKRLDWNAVAAQIVAFADKAIQVIKNIFSYLSKAFDWFMSNKDKIASALSGLGTLFGFIGTSINMVTKLADGFIAVLKTIGDIAILLGRGLVFSFGALFNSISALFNNIKMIFVNLVNAARNWGRDMIQGFINGIVSAAQALINRVKELAAKIRSYLHFSRPDVGPLRDYETWMPDMLKGMANSLKANSYILDNAVAGLAGRMSANVAAGTSIGSINMSVYGAQGQSVDAIANAVMRKMYTATKQRGFSV